MANKPICMSQDNGCDVSLLPMEKYEQAWQAMPEYTSHHAAFVARTALPRKWEPEDLVAYLVVFRNARDAAQEIQRQFIERLKETLEVPHSRRVGAVLVGPGQGPGVRPGSDHGRGLRPRGADLAASRLERLNRRPAPAGSDPAHRLIEKLKVISPDPGGARFPLGVNAAPAGFFIPKGAQHASPLLLKKWGITPQTSR